MRTVEKTARLSDGTTADSLDDVLVLDGISVAYGGTKVLHDVNLSVGEGELIALLGPSGSGKSTIIRTISGFVAPSSGSISLLGRDLVSVPIHKRNVGMVFQSYALFPHMSIFDNIAYPLRIQRKDARFIKARCNELIDLVRLRGHEKKRPAGLSGGQQQRVALARALAMDPALLLLDEPLSNLDANLRREVGEEIRRLQQRTGTTTIMVTHDRGEAFGMADRIAVLRDGRIEQFDTPQNIYRNPINSFMAGFVGDANFVNGFALPRADGGCAIDSELGEIICTRPAEGRVTAVLRPEDIVLATGTDAQEANVFDALVTESFYYGASLTATVTVNERPLQITVSGELAAKGFSVGDRVKLSVAPESVVVIPEEG